MGLRWELAFIDATEFTATKCNLPTKLYLKLTYFLSRCSFYVDCSKMFLLVSIPSFGHVDRKIEANKLATSDQQYQILPGKGIEYNNNTRRWILSLTKNEWNSKQTLNWTKTPKILGRGSIVCMSFIITHNNCCYKGKVEKALENITIRQKITTYIRSVNTQSYEWSLS